MKYFVLIPAFLMFLALTPVSHAAAPTTPDEQKTIQEVENYLNNLDTARARFVQTTANSTRLVGTFYLDRPGKLRFEYDDPVDDFIVADGTFIYFYDAELEQQSNALIGQTLADFFLSDNIKLSDDITVQDVKRTSPYLRLTLYQTDDPNGGALMLALAENPLRLEKWRVIDAQGAVTEIALYHLQTGVQHPDGLFTYRNPKTDGQPKYNQ